LILFNFALDHILHRTPFSFSERQKCGEIVFKIFEFGFERELNDLWTEREVQTEGASEQREFDHRGRVFELRYGDVEVR